MNELVTVRNTVNRGVTKVRRRIAEHPVFGKHLEIVPDGTKPYVPLTQIVDEARPQLLAPVTEDEVEDDDLEEEED